MYGPLLMIVFYLQRYALNARRKSRTWHYLAWSAVSAVVTSLLVIGLVFLIYLFFYVRLWWIGLILIGLALWPLIASWTIRHVLVRLGAYRVAYVLALGARPGKDPQAYALCVAAWALAYDRSGAGEA